MTGDTKVKPVDEVLAPVQEGGATSSGDRGGADEQANPDKTSVEFDELCARNPIGGRRESNEEATLQPGSEVRLKDLIANPNLKGVAGVTMKKLEFHVLQMLLGI